MKEIYRVIEIMNDKEIVINYGSIDGAKVNQLIRIYEEGEPIIDPVTKKTLGTLDLVKDQLTVDVVFDNFSILRKPEYIQHSILDPLANLYITKKKYRAISVNQLQISNRNIPKSSYIQIGDKAVVIEK